MSFSLLQHAIEAHGGMENWRRYSDFVTDIELGGDLCIRNGLPGLIEAYRLLLSLRERRTVTLLPGGEGLILTDHGEISHISGDVMDTDAPASASSPEGAAMSRTGQFMGFLVRNSLLAPFIYTEAGLLTEEVEPWEERGELWRVLRVAFPAGLGIPACVQYAYYGDDGLLRRTRGSGAFFGERADIANYVTSYMTLGDIKIPQAREVYLCGPSGEKTGDSPVARIRFVNSFFSE